MNFLPETRLCATSISRSFFISVKPLFSRMKQIFIKGIIAFPGGIRKAGQLCTLTPLTIDVRAFEKMLAISLVFFRDLSLETWLLLLLMLLISSFICSLMLIEDADAFSHFSSSSPVSSKFSLTMNLSRSLLPTAHGLTVYKERDF